MTNFIMRQATFYLPAVRDFFSDWSGITSFFPGHSISIVDETVERILPRVSLGGRNFIAVGLSTLIRTKVVQTIFVFERWLGISVQGFSGVFIWVFQPVYYGRLCQI